MRGFGFPGGHGHGVSVGGDCRMGVVSPHTQGHGSRRKDKGKAPAR